MTERETERVMTKPLQLLCLSDLHGQFSLFPPAKMPDADAVLIAGDITDQGMRSFLVSECAVAAHWIATLAARYPAVFYVLGNHDLDMPRNYFEPASTCLEETVVTLSPDTASFSITLAGINLSPCFDAPRLATNWQHMTARPEVDQAAFESLPAVDVLVSHCPPYGTLDRTRNLRHIGSPGLRDYLHRHEPRLIVCGHVHEAVGVEYQAFPSGKEACVVNTACTATLVTLPATGRVEVEILG